MLYLESQTFFGFSISFLNCTLTYSIRIKHLLSPLYKPLSVRGSIQHFILFCCHFLLFLKFPIWLPFYFHFMIFVVYTFWWCCVYRHFQMEILMDDGTFQRMEIEYWIQDLSPNRNGYRSIWKVNFVLEFPWWFDYLSKKNFRAFLFL